MAIEVVCHIPSCPLGRPIHSVQRKMKGSDAKKNTVMANEIPLKTYLTQKQLRDTPTGLDAVEKQSVTEGIVLLLDRRTACWITFIRR